MRRGLILLAVLAAATAVPAAASTPIRWTLISQGIASGAPSQGAEALIATSSTSARRVTAHLPAAAVTAAGRVNFHSAILVGVYGPFGCTDGRVHITRIDETGKTLVLRLAVKPLPPGVASCMAIFETYRLLVVPRRGLATIPTAARVTVARA